MTDVSPPAIVQPASPRLMSAVIGFYSLFGGPVAWLAALCGGFVLATQACMTDGVPRMEPAAGLQWTGTAMGILMGVAVLIALSSAFMAWRAFKGAHLSVVANQRDAVDAGVGRDQFLALWGVLLGSVFALATTMTALGFFLLPRCAGA
jgi:hypothetical protein